MHWLLCLVLLSTPAFPERDARPDELALIDAVKKVGGKSVQGEWSLPLCEITREWAKAMASRHQVSVSPTGHDGFSKGTNPRGERAMASTQAIGAAEVLASTYGFETTIEEHANSCAQGWLQSPSHRIEMMEKHDYYCYSMAKSSDQKYYCIGIFTDKERRLPRARP